MFTVMQKGSYLSVFLGLLLVMPGWILAADMVSNPDLEAIKQLRQVQNQSIRLQNIQAKSIQVNPTPEQERMLQLSNMPSKLTAQKGPNLERSHKFHFSGSDVQVPQVQREGSREVLFNHGALKNANDSLYFNFLTGQNSADSVGMDVRITGNEGTNFGDEYANWGDPSLLYYWDISGSLEDVTEVPNIDDPTVTWTTVSWDWAGGNGGQPLAVGNIWIVYARTSQMYVALEVTYVEPWNQYFEFDYLIQTDGTTLFDGLPTSIDMTVNGLDGDTLSVGANPYFEIQLDTAPMGEIVIFWDANHNGEWDDNDPPIEMYEFMDNEMNDENPADGVYAFTYTDEMAEGINYLADDLLFVAFSAMNFASVPVQFYTVPSAFSISGYIFDVPNETPLEGIIVWANYEWSDIPALVVISDEDGYFQLDLPDSGLVYLGTEDYFGITDDFFPQPPMHEVMVLGHETGYDFMYSEPTSGIQGYVTDELGNPVADVEVRANMDGPGYSSLTDEDGYYFIGLNPGGYDIEVDPTSLPEPYVVPFGTWVDVGDFALANLDIMIFSINNTISGIVTLDGAPWPNVMVFGAADAVGYSITMTESDGTYSLPIHDMGGTYYSLQVFNGDQTNIIQTSQNWMVPPGAINELITLETVSGGLYGYFIDGNTNQPIMDSYDIGMMLRDVNTGMEFYNGPNYDGYYEIYVPEGIYELQAGGLNWSFEDYDTLMIGDQLMEHNITLYPITFDAHLDGIVRSSDGYTIPMAEVQIGNDGWGMGMTTGPDGHYSFDLPSGFYYMHVWAPGYAEEYTDVSIMPGQNQLDFTLQSFELDGAIHGLISDEDNGLPVEGATVYASGDMYSASYHTNMDGTFWIDLPNGVYDIVVEHPGYLLYWSQGHEVFNDTTYLNVPLEIPNGGLEGVVFDDMGYEIFGAQIMIVGLEDSIAFWGNSNEAGYYAIPAINGSYEVLANAPGFEPANLGTITINDNWVYMDITLMPYQFATPPQIAFIIDQPQDQGRNVRMQFWPGGTEWGPFMGYSIWRMTNTPMGEIIDFVDYLPYHDLEAYNLVLPTLVDSSTYTTPDQYLTGFMVTGHWDGIYFIDGMPGVGYSIDNIHPGIPGSLVLMASSDTGVEIGWEASMDNDFQYFEVHRATTPTFADATITPIVEPHFMDANVTVGQTYYYQVMAVDANGNIGDGTNVVTTSIVSVDDASVLPTVFGLSQNYPNPFNPTTSIEFALPEASQVSLEIYNLLGQRVRTLVNGYIAAGYINTHWDGLDQNGSELSSGTYIYRLKAGDMSFSKKMVLMK